MGVQTKIQWADSTWNPWRGCAKVSPGCVNCYADAGSKRNLTVLGQWGTERQGGTRVVASEDGPNGWAAPVKWDAAIKAGKAAGPHYVFPSWCDPFEGWDGMMHAHTGRPLWWCGGSMSNSEGPQAEHTPPGFKGWVTRPVVRVARKAMPPRGEGEGGRVNLTREPPAGQRLRTGRQ